MDRKIRDGSQVRVDVCFKLLSLYPYLLLVFWSLTAPLT